MKQPIAGVLAALLGVSLLVACGGGNAPAPSTTPTFNPGPCGFPPPIPSPELALAYPEPGATGVPTTVGTVILSALFFPSAPTNPVTITSASGSVPVGTFTTAPSPLPSPYASPAGGSNIPYIAASIPTLAPSTTYTVSFTYNTWDNNPPTCQTQVTQKLGAFTTN